MPVFELLVSDGRIVQARGVSGPDAALSYADAHHAEFMRTGARVVRWRLPAVRRYIPRDERF